jgi:hypothetical protein
MGRELIGPSWAALALRDAPAALLRGEGGMNQNFT